LIVKYHSLTSITVWYLSLVNDAKILLVFYWILIKSYFCISVAHLMWWEKQKTEIFKTSAPYGT